MGVKGWTGIPKASEATEGEMTRRTGCILLISGRTSGYLPCLPSLGQQPSLAYLIALGVTEWMHSQAVALGCHRVDANPGSSQKPSATAHQEPLSQHALAQRREAHC